MVSRKSLAQISKESEQKHYFASDYGFSKKTDFKIGSDVYVIPLDLENGLFTGRYHEVQARKVGTESRGLQGKFTTYIKCKGYDDEGNKIEGAKCCELYNIMKDRFPGSAQDDPTLTKKRVIGYSKERIWLPVMILGNCETDTKIKNVPPTKLSIKTFDFSYIEMSQYSYNKMIDDLIKKLKDEVGAIEYEADEDEQKAIAYEWLNKCVIKVHGATPTFGGDKPVKEYSFFPFESAVIGKLSGEHDAIANYKSNTTVMNAITDFMTLFSSEVEGLLVDVSDEALEKYVIEGSERAQNVEAFKQATAEEEEAKEEEVEYTQEQFNKEVGAIESALTDDEITFDTDEEESAFMEEDSFDEEFV